ESVTVDAHADRRWSKELASDVTGAPAVTGTRETTPDADPVRGAALVNRPNRSAATLARQRGEHAAIPTGKAATWPSRSATAPWVLTAWPITAASPTTPPRLTIRSTSPCPSLTSKRPETTRYT